MKKLFLTSGVILCMACPAFAATDIPNGGGNADCTYTYLDSYSDPVSLEAKWDPVYSGAITLDSKRYTSTSDDQGTAATTAASPTPLYSVYGVGVFSGTAPTAGTLGNFTTANRMTTLTQSPVLTGYNFEGFYTGKAGTGTQVISANGSIQYDAASNTVTSNGGTTTWYAHWSAKTISITYTCGTLPSGASTGPISGSAPAQATNIAYDSTYTLASTANTCTLAGYHFKGWSCNYEIGDQGAANSGYVADSNTSTLTYTAAISNNVGTITSPTTITVKSANNITCNAIWEANNIGLTWKDGIGENGGSTITVDNNSSECSYDGSIVLPTAPTRNGYTFTGWTVTNPSSGN